VNCPHASKLAEKYASESTEEKGKLVSINWDVDHAYFRALFSNLQYMEVQCGELLYCSV